MIKARELAPQMRAFTLNEPLTLKFDSLLKSNPKAASSTSQPGCQND
jgi:hypothetical protein